MPTASISQATAFALTAQSTPKKIDHPRQAMSQLQQPARPAPWATSCRNPWAASSRNARATSSESAHLANAGQCVGRRASAAMELRREGSPCRRNLAGWRDGLRRRAPSWGGSQPAVHLASTGAPGSTGRRFCASSRSRRDHTDGGSDFERRATTSIFTACAACKGWNHRDRAWRRLSRSR